jgi:hypothetical protein
MVLERGGHGDQHDRVLAGGKGPWPTLRPVRVVENRTYVADIGWQLGSEIEASRGQQKGSCRPHGTWSQKASIALRPIWRRN